MPQMEPTGLQLDALKTDITNDDSSEAQAFKADPDNEAKAQALADLYNINAAPNYFAYRVAVPFAEIMLNGFAWSEVDNLTVGKARIWEWMRDARADHTLDASKANVRAGINEVWVGSAPKLAVRAAVYLHCQRLATRAEKLFKSAGAGTAADANGDGPATLGAEGTLVFNSVQAAWRKTTPG